MELDLQLAAAVDMPVLISGPAAESRQVATELNRRSRSRRRTIEIVDCRQQEAVAAFRSRAQRKATKRGRADSRMVLLQEIHALSAEDQALLTRQLERAQGAQPHHRVRILASSSVPLFDRVVDQLFDERLFYRLNVIHIVVPPGGWPVPPATE